MTADQPRDYDREYCRSVSGPLQIRIGLDREKDTVTRFVVQLEYHHDDDWHPVVRYDHDGTGESEHSHDVTVEGLHIDIYRDDEKHATEYISAVGSGAEGLVSIASKNIYRTTYNDSSTGTSDGTESITDDRRGARTGRSGDSRGVRGRPQ